MGARSSVDLFCDSSYSKQLLWVDQCDNLWRTVLEGGDSWWHLGERSLEEKTSLDT